VALAFRAAGTVWAKLCPSPIQSQSNQVAFSAAARQRWLEGAPRAVEAEDGHCLFLACDGWHLAKAAVLGAVYDTAVDYKIRELKRLSPVACQTVYYKPVHLKEP
jgi:hypothetical protein